LPFARRLFNLAKKEYNVYEKSFIENIRITDCYLGAAILDKQTKDLIKSQIDESMKEPILQEIEWASKELFISSLRDFALGYVIGTTGALGMSIAAARSKPEDKFEDANKVIREIVDKKLPELVEKINRELKL
jgi:hypothetical protein